MRARRIAALVALVATMAACASPTAPPPRQPQSAERPSGRPLDPQQAERLKRVMVPLIQAMNNPKPLNRVRIGIIDDASINAASGGGFFATHPGTGDRIRHSRSSASQKEVLTCSLRAGSTAVGNANG
jgi:Zn-dependent protease with chaperone function